MWKTWGPSTHISFPNHRPKPSQFCGGNEPTIPVTGSLTSLSQLTQVVLDHNYVCTFDLHTIGALRYGDPLDLVEREWGGKKNPFSLHMQTGKNVWSVLFRTLSSIGISSFQFPVSFKRLRLHLAHEGEGGRVTCTLKWLSEELIGWAARPALNGPTKKVFVRRRQTTTIKPLKIMTRY